MSEGISVVIPAYNEAHAIADTIRRVFAICRMIGKPFEVIVVDDGSGDGTGELAEQAGAAVLRNPANGGYGLSLQRGIQAAKYDTIAITDSDGTYPIEDLPRLYAEMQKGFDMVVGARQGSMYEGSLIKSFSRKIFRWLAEYTAGRKIPDINSGLRMFRRDIAVQHLSLTCQGFSFTTSLTLIFMLQGKFVHYLPIAYHVRIGHTKVRHVRDALRTLQIMTEVIIHYNPLKLFILWAVGVAAAGIVVAGVGFAAGDAVIFIAGWIFLAAAALVFSMGFLADRLGRR
ncbi:MAG: glycosyltransferase family 2 protein [bacterium]|nr:glycosyltransferase family 2 protein [bacterium]